MTEDGNTFIFHYPCQSTECYGGVGVPALTDGGTFGFGGDARTGYGSGSGGYFGGGAGSYSFEVVSSGCGGSSFIAGYPGCTINKSYSKFTFSQYTITTGSRETPKIIITLNSLLTKSAFANYLSGKSRCLSLIFCVFMPLK